MIYFNMGGALGAPKAIFASGSISEMAIDIAVATAQVYLQNEDPEFRMRFKKTIQAVRSKIKPTRGVNECHGKNFGRHRMQRGAG